MTSPSMVTRLIPKIAVMAAPTIERMREVLSEAFGARFIFFAVFTTVFSTLFVLRAVTFAFGLVLVRVPLRGELTFFGLSESLEMSAMRPMGHSPKANSAAMMIQPPTSTSFFFFVFPPLSSKRNEPVSGSYSKSLLIYLFSFFLPALAARSRSKSTIFVFLPVFSSST